jgi:hypothetical protein
MSHVYGGSCHHGLARLRVADGGDGLQIWRAAANIFNKQTQTRSGLPVWGLGEVLTTPHHKKQLVTKFYTGTRNWTDSLERPRRIWLRVGANGWTL